MRIELLEGQWAELRPHMTLPMRDAFNECIRATQAAPDPVAEITPEMELSERGLVLASIKEWSYGAINMETLEKEVPLEDQEKLAQAAVKVVLQSPLAKRAFPGSAASGGNGSSRRSSATGRSRRSSPSRTSAP